MASYFVNLPAEILLEIFSHLADPSSLISLMHSNTRFYGVAKTHEKSLVTRVLSNLLTPELLPQAIAVFEASTVENWEDATVREVISRFRETKYIRKCDLSLDDALNIEKRHRAIVPVMDRFVASAFFEHPLVARYQARIELPLSNNERIRIARAFYRFELYANIFRPQLAGQASECELCNQYSLKKNDLYQITMVCIVSPIELEQLATVAEFISYAVHNTRKMWEGDPDFMRLLPTFDFTTWRKETIEFFRHPLLKTNESSNKVVHRHNPALSEWEDTPSNFPVATKPCVNISYDGAMTPDLDKGPENALRWATKLMQVPTLDFDDMVILQAHRGFGHILWDKERLRADAELHNTLGTQYFPLDDEFWI